MAYIETELYKVLGSYLRVAREASGLTLSEVSKKIDSTLMTVQRYEKGDRKITVEKIRTLCSLYGVDADTLMQDSIDALRKKDSNDCLVLNIKEERMMSLFRTLNNEGQSKAVGYVSDLVASGNYSTSGGFDCQLAAHERTDIEGSEEDRKHDLDIMNSDDF